MIQERRTSSPLEFGRRAKLLWAGLKGDSKLGRFLDLPWS